MDLGTRTPCPVDQGSANARDGTIYMIPEDGSPITIGTSRESQTSLLIEYFEGGNGKQVDSTHHPGVIVRTSPSSKKKNQLQSDHISSSTRKGDQATFTKCIPLATRNGAIGAIINGESGGWSVLHAEGTDPITIEIPSKTDHNPIHASQPDSITIPMSSQEDAHTNGVNTQADGRNESEEALAERMRRRLARRSETQRRTKASQEEKRSPRIRNGSLSQEQVVDLKPSLRPRNRSLTRGELLTFRPVTATGEDTDMMQRISSQRSRSLTRNEGLATAIAIMGLKVENNVRKHPKRRTRSQSRSHQQILSNENPNQVDGDELRHRRRSSRRVQSVGVLGSNSHEQNVPSRLDTNYKPYDYFAAYPTMISPPRKRSAPHEYNDYISEHPWPKTSHQLKISPDNSFDKERDSALKMRDNRVSQQERNSAEKPKPLAAGLVGLATILGLKRSSKSSKPRRRSRSTAKINGLPSPPHTPHETVIQEEHPYFSGNGHPSTSRIPTTRYEQMPEYRTPEAKGQSSIFYGESILIPNNSASSAGDSPRRREERPQKPISKLPEAYEAPLDGIPGIFYWQDPLPTTIVVRSEVADEVSSIQDRRTNIRKNVAERAARRQNEEESRGGYSQKTDREDAETLRKETVESQVAKTKPRLAELMEHGATPPGSSSPPFGKTYASLTALALRKHGASLRQLPKDERRHRRSSEDGYAQCDGPKVPIELPTDSLSPTAVQDIPKQYFDEILFGKREDWSASIHSTALYGEDDVWHLLSKDLEKVGVTPQLFAEHKDLVMRTLKEAVESGISERDLQATYDPAPLDGKKYYRRRSKIPNDNDGPRQCDRVPDSLPVLSAVPKKGILKEPSSTARPSTRFPTDARARKMQHIHDIYVGATSQSWAETRDAKKEQQQKSNVNKRRVSSTLGESYNPIQKVNLPHNKSRHSGHRISSPFFALTSLEGILTLKKEEEKITTGDGDFIQSHEESHKVKPISRRITENNGLLLSTKPSTTASHLPAPTSAESRGSIFLQYNRNNPHKLQSQNGNEDLASSSQALDDNTLPSMAATGMIDTKEKASNPSEYAAKNNRATQKATRQVSLFLLDLVVLVLVKMMLSSTIIFGYKINIYDQDRRILFMIFILPSSYGFVENDFLANRLLCSTIALKNADNDKSLNMILQSSTQQLLSPPLTTLTRHNETTNFSEHERSNALVDYFPHGRLNEYTDRDLQYIAELLKSNERNAWSEIPRIYTVLRVTGQLEKIESFIDQGITDIWFPFSHSTLPATLTGSMRAQFIEAQSIVMTKGLNLEKDTEKRHAQFERHEILPFKVMNELGHGRFSPVHRIISLVSKREFARKRFRKRKGARFEAEMEAFNTELQILKRIRHPHCVELIASYTDPKWVGLIMSPVADCDLKAYFDVVAHNHSTHLTRLRSFFGCLTAALEYLHRVKIHHRDIKPENILVKGGAVYLTDFGISLDWEARTRSTTTSDSSKTILYCAPEMAKDEPRNMSSDIWSLGCVFLEIVTVLKGRAIEDMHNHFKQSKDDNYRYYSHVDQISTWSDTLRQLGLQEDNVALLWALSMLRVTPAQRPTASRLFYTISAQGATRKKAPSRFVGSCCELELSSDDSGSDV